MSSISSEIAPTDASPAAPIEFEPWKPPQKPVELTLVEGIQEEVEREGTYTIQPDTFFLMKDTACHCTVPIKCDITGRFIPPGEMFSDTGIVELLPTSLEVHQKYIEYLAIMKRRKQEEGSSKGASIKQPDGSYIRNKVRDDLLAEEKVLNAEIARLRREVVRQWLWDNPDIAAVLGNPDLKSAEFPLYEIKIATNEKVDKYSVPLADGVEG